MHNKSEITSFVWLYRSLHFLFKKLNINFKMWGETDFLNSFSRYETKKKLEDHHPRLPSLTEQGWWKKSKMKREASQVVHPCLSAHKEEEKDTENV